MTDKYLNHSDVIIDPYVMSTSESIEAFLYTKIIILLAVFGIIGNLLNLVVLTRKAFGSVMERMEISAHIGLISLAVSDWLFCVVLIPKYFVHQAEFSFHRGNSPSLLYQASSDAIINIFQMASTWLTISIAVTRYIAVCHPFLARISIGRTSAIASVTSSFILAAIFNIPRFWEQTIKHVNCLEGYKAYYISPGYLRTNNTSRSIYLWFYFILNILIPILILGYCNIKLVQQVKSIRNDGLNRHHRINQSRRRSTDNLTLTLALLVIFYIVLVTPAEVTNFVLLIAELEPKQLTDGFNLALAILNTLQTANFAVNFILYCSINSRFRSVMGQLICRNRNPPDWSRVSGVKNDMNTRMSMELSKRTNQSFVITTTVSNV